MLLPRGLLPVAVPVDLAPQTPRGLLPTASPKGSAHIGISCRIWCWPVASRGRGHDTGGPTTGGLPDEHKTEDPESKVESAAGGLAFKRTKVGAATTGPATKRPTGDPGTKGASASGGPTLEKASWGPKSKEEAAALGPANKMSVAGSPGTKEGPPHGWPWIKILVWTGPHWELSGTSHAPEFWTSPDDVARPRGLHFGTAASARSARSSLEIGQCSVDG
jgi:hypothetical protein